MLDLSRSYNRRLTTAAGRRLARSGGAASAWLPTRVSGLLAGWDATSDAYLTFGTGAAVSSWVARAGSLGALTWSQATAASRATRALSVATLGGKNAMLFDGTDDFFTSSTTNDWAKFHNGTGASIYIIGRPDSTGGTAQTIFNNANGASAIGTTLRWLDSTGTNGQRMQNGSGTYLNQHNVVPGTADTTAWMMWAYADELFTQAKSGTITTNADAVAQEPSASNPSAVALLGGLSPAGSGRIKGYITHVLFYDHVLTAGELAKLAPLAVSCGAAA